MARQKSEDCIRPQGRRKSVVTRGVERPGGGKAVPVNEQTKQLELPFETAEETTPRGAVADGGAARLQWRATPLAVPKSESKDEKVSPATTEEVIGRLSKAFQNVASNRGAPGPDGQSIEEVRQHLDEILRRLEASLLKGTYEPGNIRRVWIPKAGGGKRGLGIPGVIDSALSPGNSLRWGSGAKARGAASMVDGSPSGL